MKHFIDLKDIPAIDLRKILIDAKKRKRLRGKLREVLVEVLLDRFTLHRVTLGEDVDTNRGGHHVEEAEEENTTDGTPRHFKVNLSRGNRLGIVVHPGCAHSIGEISHVYYTYRNYYSFDI